MITTSKQLTRPINQRNHQNTQLFVSLSWLVSTASCFKGMVAGALLHTLETAGARQVRLDAI